MLNKKLKSTKFPTKKIKIMFVTGALSFGGLERVVINLCKYINPEIFVPIIVCLKSRGELAYEVENIGISFYCLNANQNQAYKYFTWWQLRKILKKEKPILIHSHNTDAFLDSAIASIGLPIKLVHTDHARTFPDKLRYMIAERAVAIRTEKIIAVSETLKYELIKYEKIPKNKINVILNGIEPPSVIRENEKKSYLNNIVPKKFKYVIGLGVVLTKQKGIIYLIRAAPLILKKFPNTAFIIAGDGPERIELENEVDKLGMNESFIFLGLRKDIPELLSLLNIYVLPSVWEGLPLSILEAMAARKCIISTDVGGIPIALKNNYNAILIPPKRPDLIAEKIIFLLENGSVRKELADNAYNSFKERFDVKIMVSHYEKLYLKCLGYPI